MSDLAKPKRAGKSGWTLQQKVELVCTLAGDKRLTDGEFRVAEVLILYFHNTTSGECFPSYQQLAERAGKDETTAKRATSKLRAIGIIDFVNSTGGRCRRNTYSLQRVAPVDPLEQGKGAPADPTGAPVDPLGGPVMDPHIPREYIQKSEASTPTLKRVESSQKKNGLQRRASTKAPFYSQPQFKTEVEDSMPHDDATKAKNLAKIARDSIRPMYRPSLSPEEVLRNKVEADARKWMGDEAYQIIAAAVTEEHVRQAALVESWYPGKGHRTLVAFAGLSSWRYEAGPPLPDGAHGPTRQIRWADRTVHHSERMH